MSHTHKIEATFLQKKKKKNVIAPETLLSVNLCAVPPEVSVVSTWQYL